MNIKTVGDGNVVLIAGGGKVYTDVAARFCRSEKALGDILASPTDERLVRNILASGHSAATEFDYFLFGIEGYARVTEVQLVRKRLASYMIKSGRVDKGGKRSFDVVLPGTILGNEVIVDLDPSRVLVGEHSTAYPVAHGINAGPGHLKYVLDVSNLLGFIESWYNEGVAAGYPEEDLRYLKPQATEFKAIIGMNAHALLDWFKIRCCNRAQTEIRDLATKMLRLCKKASPVLFENAGPSCKSLGYCPEGEQCKQMEGLVMTHAKVKALIANYMATTPATPRCFYVTGFLKDLKDLSNTLTRKGYLCEPAGCANTYKICAPVEKLRDYIYPYKCMLVSAQYFDDRWALWAFAGGYERPIVMFDPKTLWYRDDVSETNCTAVKEAYKRLGINFPDKLYLAVVQHILQR